ncbi:MAG: DUF4249 family protein [Bacteroidetes bacterium]|jgi:hypothetical protein|nr:DUF4249 family protein [Bacteroidota bacterium]
MMNKLLIKNPIYLISLVLVTLACEKELPLNIPEYEQLVVVEGMVEPGEKTRVLLSLTAPFFNDYDSVSMLDYRLTTAKVVMRYDSVSEVLRLTKNKKYFPPFVYESTSRGETGKNYSLEVTHGGDTISASTYIPKPTSIDSLWYEQKPDKDSSFYFRIQFTDDPATKDYYILFTRVRGKEQKFYPTRTAAYDDALFSGKQVTFRMERGVTSVLDVNDMQSYRLGDIVVVKLCTVNKAVYEYWNSYQNLLISSANPFSSPSNELESNINNGIGIFGGYGATLDTVVIIKKGDE